MHRVRRRCAREALILAATHKVLDLDEGRVYRGDVAGGRPHGEGTMIRPNGATSTGQRAGGARHDTGTYREREGATYVGKFRDGERAGRGRFT